MGPAEILAGGGNVLPFVCIPSSVSPSSFPSLLLCRIVISFLLCYKADPLNTDRGSFGSTVSSPGGVRDKAPAAVAIYVHFEPVKPKRVLICGTSLVLFLRTKML